MNPIINKDQTTITKSNQNYHKRNTKNYTKKHK